MLFFPQNPPSENSPYESNSLKKFLFFCFLPSENLAFSPTTFRNSIFLFTSLENFVNGGCILNGMALNKLKYNCFFLSREYIERKGYHGKERKVSKLSQEEVMIPIKRELAEEIQQEQMEEVKSFLFSLKGKIQYINDEKAIKRKFSPQDKLELAIVKFLQTKDTNLDEIMYKDLPSHWEQHGDLILLPEKCFTQDRWEDFGAELWQVVAETLGAKRIAKKSTICRDGFRTPQVSLLLGHSGWVMHIENGIKYTFDVTKCMFSAGNITEKIRVGNFDCKGQTIVDLYAGIGYFVLPYLVHAKAAMVYACEWNENAIEALRTNLKINNVDEQCVIYEGNNQKVKKDVGLFKVTCWSCYITTCYYQYANQGPVVRRPIST